MTKRIHFSLPRAHWKRKSEQKSICQISKVTHYLFSPLVLHTHTSLSQSTTVRSQQHPMFVVVSCGCCFLQSCIAFGILLPILYSRKCSVTFLKMQFCTATSTAMAIFALGFLKLLPQVSKIISFSFFLSIFFFCTYQHNNIRAVLFCVHKHKS